MASLIFLFNNSFLPTKMTNEEEPQQKLIITDSSKIYDVMSSYYLKETFSDIQLILSDKTLHAHKIVLAARCKYFESLLLQDPKQTQIELINVPSKALETILYYIYTGTVVIASLDENYVSDILKLAHEYSLKTLVQTINEKMVSIVDLSNVCFLLNVANAHDIDKLKEICHTFVDEHVSQTFEHDFLNVLTQKSMVNLLKRDAFPVQEIDIFKIAANWCKINEDLDSLVIECIRFPCLTRNEILNVVWPSKVVDNEKLLKVLATIENNGTKETQRHVFEKFVIKNLATGEYNVKVISGLNTTMLFEETENEEDGAYHNEDDKDGITVDLAGVKCFNHITMNIRESWVGYRIEISTDLQKWHNVIDYSIYECIYNQNLYFEQQKARYIRIIFESSSARICKFQVYMSRNVPTIHNQVVCPSSNVITSETVITCRETSPGSFTTHLYLNQPYMISRIKVTLQFHTSISSIETSTDNSPWEKLELPKDKNLLLRFNKRIVNCIRIIGQLSRNVVSSIILLTVLVIVYSIDS
ncbi:BTB/POZ domain-containing protein 9-like isoform X1 [Zophobas morio]|uniref:BTB/POZ domain-containing protein 9-like isoform X1 n=1 Tax=Zophobas morio TaxID=2755281 RepID=UPI003083EB77